MSATSLSWRGETIILLVEDNPADAALFRLAMVEAGVQCFVHVAPNAKDALEFLRKHSADLEPATRPLMVLDWNLPGLPGVALLRQLKVDESLQRIPVVVFSSSERAADVQLGYETGANGWVVKPTALESYLATVRAMLKFWLQDASLPLLVENAARGAAAT